MMLIPEPTVQIKRLLMRAIGSAISSTARARSSGRMITHKTFFVCILRKPFAAPLCA